MLTATSSLNSYLFFLLLKTKICFENLTILLTWMLCGRIGVKLEFCTSNYAVRAIKGWGNRSPPPLCMQKRGGGLVGKGTKLKTKILFFLFTDLDSDLDPD